MAEPQGRGPPPLHVCGGCTTRSKAGCSGRHVRFPAYAGWRRGFWPRARPGWAGVDPVQALAVQRHTPVHAPVSCPGDRAARPACGPCDAPVPRNPAPVAPAPRSAPLDGGVPESELFIHSLRSSSAIRSSCRRTGPELRPAPPAAPRPRHLGLYHRTQPRQQLMLLRDHARQIRLVGHKPQSCST